MAYHVVTKVDFRRERELIHHIDKPQISPLLMDIGMIRVERLNGSLNERRSVEVQLYQVSTLREWLIERSKLVGLTSPKYHLELGNQFFRIHDVVNTSGSPWPRPCQMRIERMETCHRDLERTKIRGIALKSAFTWVKSDAFLPHRGKKSSAQG